MAEDVDPGAGEAKRRALREAAARLGAQAKGALRSWEWGRIVELVG